MEKVSAFTGKGARVSGLEVSGYRTRLDTGKLIFNIDYKCEVLIT